MDFIVSVRKFMGVALLFLVLATSPVLANTPFYVIAHMANSEKAVQWAMKQGANAVEIDLHFNSQNEPERFQHGGFCDCNCPLISWFSKPSICGQIECDTSSAVNTMLTYLAKTDLLLIVIDSKLSSSDSSDRQKIAGERIIKNLETLLFDSGYKGKVLVSVENMGAEYYIARANEFALTSKYSDRIFFAFDRVDDGAIDKLVSLKVKNMAYANGITSCWNEPKEVSMSITNAIKARNNNIISFVYVWTLDKDTSMKHYVDMGVDGIITNEPMLLKNIANKIE